MSDLMTHTCFLSKLYLEKYGLNIKYIGTLVKFCDAINFQTNMCESLYGFYNPVSSINFCDIAPAFDIN